MPLCPIIRKERRATGNIRFRLGWRRRLVLQVEIEVENYLGICRTETFLSWRDASVSDLLNLDLWRHPITLAGGHLT